MAEKQKITVQRTIDAPADKVFEVLTNPGRHAEFDGAGMVRSDEKSDRIQAVGDVFTMNMTNERMGDYQTDNHVTAYDENKMVGWKTAPVGSEPPGWEWLWDLDSQGSATTVVTHTYDWSHVTDSEVLKRVGFPLIGREQLEETLNRLAAAVA